MMSWLEDVWPLIVLAACVLLFFWGRNRGRQNLANMLSAARAEGHATAQAELRSLQMVNVVAGNSGPRSSDGELSHVDDRQAAALARLVALSGPEGARLVGAVDGPWEPVVLDRRGETAEERLSRAGRDTSRVGELVDEWVVTHGGNDDDHDVHDYDHDDAPGAHRRSTPNWLGSSAYRPGGWDAARSGDPVGDVRSRPSTGLGRGPGG